MFQRLLILLLCVFFSFQAFSQNLNISADTVVVYGYSSQHEVVGKAMLDNTGSETLTIIWERITNEFPSHWLGNGSQICDINLCWVDTVNSRPFDLAPGAKGNLDVHFQNNFETGEAEVQLLVYIEGDSANSAKIVTYKAFVDEATSIVERVNDDREQIRIYPNPARDHIMIKKLPDVPLKTVEIYNILGTKMETYTHNSGQNNFRIDIGELPKGVYMVRIYDNDHRLIHTKSISRIK